MVKDGIGMDRCYCLQRSNTRCSPRSDLDDVATIQRTDTFLSSRWNGRQDRSAVTARALRRSASNNVSKRLAMCNFANGSCEPARELRRGRDQFAERRRRKLVLQRRKGGLGPFRSQPG